MKEIVDAIQCVKTLYDILQANKGLIRYNETIAAVTEINTKLNDAQLRISALLQENQALTERVQDIDQKMKKLKSVKSEIRKYVLHTFPIGTSALAIKPAIKDSNPVHYLCENCANNGQIARLQPDAFQNGTSFYLRCHVCALAIRTRESSPAMDKEFRARMGI